MSISNLPLQSTLDYGLRYFPLDVIDRKKGYFLHDQKINSWFTLHHGHHIKSCKLNILDGTDRTCHAPEQLLTKKQFDFNNETDYPMEEYLPEVQS